MQNFGKYNYQKNSIWIHASSIGETRSAIKIIDGIKKNNHGVKFIISTSTSSPTQLLKKDQM